MAFRGVYGRLARTEFALRLQPGRLGSRRSPVERLDRGDLDAEAGEADIGARVVGPEPDRGDPEIAQDLGAEPDLAPLRLARFVRAGRAPAQVRRHSRRPLAEVDERAAPLRLEAGE